MHPDPDTPRKPFMNHPRLISPECDGWHLVEMALHRDRADWTDGQRATVRAVLREWERYMHGRVDAHLITRRSLHLLVHLGNPPYRSDAEVLARIQSFAHPITTRKAQLALHRAAHDPEWRRLRAYWQDASGEISNALKWLGTALRSELYDVQSPGALWRHRVYSHPVEPKTAVLNGVRAYLAALALRHGHEPANSLASAREGSSPPDAALVSALAKRLHRGKRPRRPPGLFGRFSERVVKRQLRREGRTDEERREAQLALDQCLERFLLFRARHGHDRVWESPAHADLLPWLRKMNRLHRIDRIRPEHREALLGAGYTFPSFRHVRKRSKLPPLPQPATPSSP